jgi:hypothetical protein
MDSMRPILTGLIGAVVTLLLLRIADRRQKSARTLSDGWKSLRPSWLINFFIILSAGLAGFLAYFLANGGSALPDAEKQNAIAALILAVSGLYAVYCVWVTYGRSVMWNDDELRVRSVFEGEIVHHISDIEDVTKSELWGHYRITLRDGSRLRVNAYLHGAKELVDDLL